MKHGFIMHEPNNQFGYFGWPSITRLESGRLVVVASGYRFKHLCPFGKIVMSYSDDDGLSWSQPKIIYNSPLDDRDAGIISKGKQVLITTFNNSKAVQYDASLRYETEEDRKIMDAQTDTISNNDEATYLGSWILVSNDGGNTIRYSYKMPITSPHGPILLENGNYFYVGRSFKSEIHNENQLEEGIYFMESTDGVIWTDPIKIDTNFENYYFYEPHAVEVESGKILVSIRVQKKDSDLFTIFQTYIKNNKQLFPLKETNIEGSPPHLMKHSSGKILLSYGRRKSPFGIRVSSSNDDGITFSSEYVLRNDGLDWDLGYPATIERKDGSLITVYYLRETDEKLTSISYTIWNLKEGI